MEAKTVGDLLTQLELGESTVFDVIENVGGSTRIEIGRRKLQPEPPAEPAIARAAPVDHEFFELAAFGAFIRRDADRETAVVLADHEARQIVAVLGGAGPQFGQHERATFKALPHPFYAPWKALLNRPIPVVEFGLFVLKNRRAVVGVDGEQLLGESNRRELAHLFLQVTTAKSVEIREGAGAKSINGVMVEISIAGERKGVPVELPETLTIATPLYIGGLEQNVDFDVLVTAGRDDKPVVVLTAAAAEVDEFNAFAGMVEALAKETGYLVGMGRVGFGEWPTVGN